MSLRRESEDDENEEDDEEEEALEAVRFLGVNAEGLALTASYVGRRSIVLVWTEEWWLNWVCVYWCTMTGCVGMFLYWKVEWSGME